MRNYEYDHILTLESQSDIRFNDEQIFSNWLQKKNLSEDFSKHKFISKFVELSLTLSSPKNFCFRQMIEHLAVMIKP